MQMQGNIVYRHRGKLHTDIFHLLIFPSITNFIIYLKCMLMKCNLYVMYLNVNVTIEIKFLFLSSSSADK